MKLKTTYILYLIFLISCSGTDKKTKNNLPDYTGCVNDFENILTKEQINDLTDIIIKNEKETTNEIAIATISSFEPYKTLFDYSLDLAKYWGIGKKNKDNGILIVFSKMIREMRIQVGIGLEKKLTNEECKMIIDSSFVPEFKKGDYYAGVKKGLTEIMNEIK